MNRPPKQINLTVVVCGNIDVGKTTLIKAFSTLQSQKNQSSDEKAFNTKKAFKTSLTNIKLNDRNGDTVNTKIYDIAGNAQGRDDAKTFKSEAHCILICYSINKESSFEDIQTWLDAIDEESTNQKVPIILIGTKADLTSERVIS